MNLSSRIAWLFFSSLIVLGGGAKGFSQNTPGYNNKYRSRSEHPTT